MTHSIIHHVEQGGSLTEMQMAELVDAIMKGTMPEPHVAQLLVGLYRKGETVDEIAGAARALRWNMRPIQTHIPDVVDTCGTGGGGSGVFNISTAAAIVAAASGAHVAKHGNRKSTGKSGSADVLVELGVNIECRLETVQACLEELGICFCFAPLFHPSVRHVMNVRKQLPHPTIFNLLGPLCNPAGAKYQVLGAGRAATRLALAHALARLGTEHSIVVHGEDGLGEITNSATTDVAEIVGDQVTQWQLDPSDFGCQISDKSDLYVSGPPESAQKIRNVVAGQPGAARDVVVMNAAAALWVTGKYHNFPVAAERCSLAIDNGSAAELLQKLVQFTN